MTLTPWRSRTILCLTGSLLLAACGGESRRSEEGAKKEKTTGNEPAVESRQTDSKQPSPEAEAARASNERRAFVVMKTLASGEADFRHNDRDGNKIKDYWVGDVSGLNRYTTPSARSTPAKMIVDGLAEADAAPLKADELMPHTVSKPKPMGGYLYIALQGYRAKGALQKYHGGNHRNTSRFGFAAYPADYPTSGKRTFIINQENRVYARDTGGKPPEAYREDPLKAGWKLID